jgi:hypothetical protein
MLYCMLSLLGCLMYALTLFGGISASQYEERTKLQGTFNASEQVFKASFPRNDIRITVDGYHTTPFMGFTTWVAFTQSNTEKAEFMVMGDLVLRQEEVNPVMSLLFDRDIEVTALHNHFFYDQPKIYFMHICGKGKLEVLAVAIRQVLSEIPKLQVMPTFGSDQVPAKNAVDAAKMDKIFGVTGQAQDGRYKVVIGKKTSVGTPPFTIGKEMGVNSWAAFSGDENKAIVNGDLAVYENELQSTLKMLRKKNINVLAIHNHMTFDEPRVLFIHYWGVGKLETLALSMKEAMIGQQ